MKVLFSMTVKHSVIVFNLRAVYDRGNTINYLFRLVGLMYVRTYVRTYPTLHVILTSCDYALVNLYLLVLAAGRDYSASNTTLTFTSSNTEPCVYITILNDDIREDSEYFFVRLATSDSYVNLLHSYSTVTILDNDGMKLKAATNQFICYSLMYLAATCSKFALWHMCIHYPVQMNNLRLFPQGLFLSISVYIWLMTMVCCCVYVVFDDYGLFMLCLMTMVCCFKRCATFLCGD